MVALPPHPARHQHAATAHTHCQAVPYCADDIPVAMLLHTLCGLGMATVKGHHAGPKPVAQLANSSTAAATSTQKGSGAHQVEVEVTTGHWKVMMAHLLQRAAHSGWLSPARADRAGASTPAASSAASADSAAEAHATRVLRRWAAAYASLAHVMLPVSAVSTPATCCCCCCLVCMSLAVTAAVKEGER